MQADVPDSHIVGGVGCPRMRRRRQAFGAFQLACVCARAYARKECQPETVRSLSERRYCALACALATESAMKPLALGKHLCLFCLSSLSASPPVYRMYTICLPAKIVTDTPGFTTFGIFSAQCITKHGGTILFLAGRFILLQQSNATATTSNARHRASV